MNQNREFSEEKSKMTTKYLYQSSTSLATGEMQTNSTLRCRVLILPQAECQDQEEECC